MRRISRHTEHLKGRLLVVDDDLVQRTIIGKIGAKLGYDTIIASTFEIASELLKTEAFDIMTLDLSLGERDGVELLRLVADCNLHAMPIVIISGCDERILNSTRRVAEGLNLSLTSCLGKPLNLDNLRDSLGLPGNALVDMRCNAASPQISRERIASALARNEFSVEFQPKIDLASGKVIGAEALARWQTPEFGIMSPAIFIPLVEKFGLMPDLTDQVLSTAIANGRRLIERNPGFTIAVNISGSSMADLTLPERIERILRAGDVAPESLVVEVTESVAMSDIDRAIDILVRLRLKGVGAAIDDFGTGFSSLAALARFPFSELKIDQSFVKGCEADEDMMKIVEASVALGKAFGMRVVAEGIDNIRTLARVREAGCDVGQGYLFAPALKLEKIEKWTMQRNSEEVDQLARLEPRPVAANRFLRSTDRNVASPGTTESSG
ncbi:MAG: EAL domain-containing response regulator [Rhizobiales bacterium]|nr:EAL domain-containing response regulator [Hyphomicrobiales bacterium]